MGGNRDLHNAFPPCNRNHASMQPWRQLFSLRPLTQKLLRGHAPDWNLSPLYAQNIILNKKLCEQWELPTYLPFRVIGETNLESTQVNKRPQYCEKDK